MTGATGDLTPDDIQQRLRARASGARRVTPLTRPRSPAPRHHTPTSSPRRQPTRDEHATDAEDGPAEREPREPQIGGDERADREEHL